MPIRKVTWLCEICGSEHPTEEAAIDCEKLGIPIPQLEPGQRLFWTHTNPVRELTILDSKVRLHRSRRGNQHIVMHRMQRGKFVQHIADNTLAKGIQKGDYQLA